MHILLHPDRTYVHSEQPPGVIINALTAVMNDRYLVFTSTGIYCHDPATGLLLNEAGPEDMPPLSAEGWTAGHIPQF